MKITLISPRLAVQKGDFLGSGVPYWPIELAVLAAFLRNKGHNISAIDLFGMSPTSLEDKGDYYLQGFPLKKLTNDTSVKDADIVIVYAISVMSHHEIIDITRFLRRRQKDQTIAILENSQAVTAYAISKVASDLFEAGATALLCGEVYWNWQQIEVFLQGNKDIKVARKNIEIPQNILVANPPVAHQLSRKIETNPSYPTPAWDLFNLQNYWAIPYSHGPKTKRFLPILTSKGCPYPCDFCVVPETNNQKWRERSPEEVVEEILTLRDRFGVKHFQIEDLNPTVRSSRWDRICQLLIDKNAQIFFYFVSGTKAETVKVEQIPMYARAGCKFISISPESGSNSVLKSIGKPFNHNHALKLIKACHQYGIYTQACLLVGHPSENIEDEELSANYLRDMVRNGLDEVAIFIVSPLAGSKLYEKNVIALNASEALKSFSPKGRQDWKELNEKRNRLIKIFFIEKAKRGLALLLQGFRGFIGIPRTKMENLPRRVTYIYLIIWRYKIGKCFSGDKKKNS